MYILAKTKFYNVLSQLSMNYISCSTPGKIIPLLFAFNHYILYIKYDLVFMIVFAKGAHYALHQLADIDYDVVCVSLMYILVRILKGWIDGWAYK